MSHEMGADLVINAFRMAVGRRRPPEGMIAHSDRGVQYASLAFQEELKRYGLRCSMSRKGNCWDNAVVESFNATIKDRAGPSNHLGNPRRHARGRVRIRRGLFETHPLIARQPQPDHVRIPT